MGRWVFDCPDCHQGFTHTEISALGETQLPDPFLLWSCAKPEFPSSGMILVCPNCKKVSTYQRYDLIFQSS
jgi:hypothetical protein